ncbi:glycosyltransferase family A protein [Kitasatospora phosalacinea]|uniref:glycosyltransferase family A protein n=1 Tax=Kitasatospora phosalacinea TaxID=2065 RepID=UPI0035DD52E4
MSAEGAEGAGAGALKARRRRPAVLLAAVAALGAYGLQAEGWWTQWLWAPLAAALVLPTALHLAERPAAADAGQQRALDRLEVAVLVPVFDEDPGYLRSALAALLEQIRRPQSVHVVDDGSTVDYRYLPLHHPAFLAQVLRWYQQLAATAAAALLLTRSLDTGTPLPRALLAVPLLIVSGQTLRYLTVRSSAPGR